MFKGFELGEGDGADGGTSDGTSEGFKGGEDDDTADSISEGTSEGESEDAYDGIVVDDSVGVVEGPCRGIRHRRDACGSSGNGRLGARSCGITKSRSSNLDRAAEG